MLGNHHSILATSKKLNRLKNPQLFLNTQGREEHRANCYPQDLRPTAEYRESELPREDSGAETARGSSARVGKSELYFMSCGRLSVVNPES